ncbi:MAG: Flp pilus assembly protein CpaB [Hyphomicrobiaceae bacterium]|nr:Flp pilus assembly protein CpaB [Hyphomicrobiaceae bacterium]MCC0022697.1 Flp pilus assembly protein CpaB [Hyphomicrobiaceae bacterium]
MKPARLILLLVAIVAGGLAAFLATRGQAPAPVQPQVAQVQEQPKTRVLIAASTIGVGERLTEDLLEWQDWPQNAVRPEYITSEVLPDAPAKLLGTVARFEIFAGEPIQALKLVRTDQGYLSAVIQPGMRAVSIPVTQASGAGGFVLPNDRVDVVQTLDEGNGPVSSTILSNIKVLAMGARLGQGGTTGGAEAGDNNPQSKMFSEKSIATLELDPYQSETIIAAEAEGQLTLVLRSVADFNAPADAGGRNANQSIRMVRFGTATNVQSNAVADLYTNAAATGANADLANQIIESVVQPVFPDGLPASLANVSTPAEPAPAVKQ